MNRRRLQVLEDYEVTGLPIVSAAGLTYVRWIEQATLPYAATRLPVGRGTGLAEALHRAATANTAG